MKPKMKTEEGIVLHAAEGGAGGKVVEVFTIREGRKRLYASKNVMKHCGAGGVLPFSYLRFSFTEKEEQSILGQYESEKIFHLMDLPYEALSGWYYFIDVIRSFFPLDAADPEAFRILSGVLSMAQVKDDRVMILVGLCQLLQEAGFLGNDSKGAHLSLGGQALLSACLSYSFGETFPIPIKKEACRELADYLDKWIAVDCDVVLKTAGLFTID